MAPLLHDPTAVRLGKHLGVVEDPRTALFKRYLARAAALPAVPKTVAVTNKVPAYPMFGNDRYGDCTCASRGHALLADSTRGGSPVQVTDADVLALYAKVNGGRDEGAYMLDVLNELRRSGLGGHTIGAFVKADLRNWDHIKLGMRLFGGLYLGVALPVTAQRQAVWTVEGDAKTGDSAPGSWGGHAIWVGWATDSSASCVTWAEKKKMTRQFVQTYGDEAYFVIAPEWLGPDAKSPQGFNTAQLEADLGLI
jgi:hypothetical protein